MTFTSFTLYSSAAPPEAADRSGYPQPVPSTI
jgi:hypothetical protein